MVVSRFFLSEKQVMVLCLQDKVSWAFHELYHLNTARTRFQEQ